MSEHVVLFHSALGLRPAVRAFADQLSEAGHIVHTPDLFDGEVFDDLEHGMKKRDALGTEELAMRAQKSVSGLPSGLVFAGFSMGAAAAEMLAGTQPGARAAVLMHGALSPPRSDSRAGRRFRSRSTTPQMTRWWTRRRSRRSATRSGRPA